METTTSPTTTLPLIEFALREKKGLQVWTGVPSPVINPTLTSTSIGPLKYSPKGTYLAQIESSGVVVYSASSGVVVAKFLRAGVQYIAWSPLETHLVTWERHCDATPDGNLMVWNVASGALVGSLHQKQYVKEFWPSLQWTEDEVHVLFAVTNEVHIYDGLTVDLKHPLQKLYSDGMVACSLAPGSSGAKFRVAVFKPEKKGAPAMVKVYQYPNLTDVMAGKSFFKAQRIETKWNSNGNAVILLTHTEVDTTGKSYFGETALHYMQTDGKFECSIPLPKEGPVHDVSWAPDNKEFIVIAGHMPSKAVLYDSKCRPSFDFGNAPRNTVLFSPNGRFVALGGFGNLPGDIEFWDRAKNVKIGECRADCAVAQIWAPDSRHLITAVLAPRMRVGNGFTVWKYNGTRVFHQDFDELLQLEVRPLVPNPFPVRPPSPAPTAAAAAAAPSVGTAPATAAPTAAPAKVGAYRPPGARASGFASEFAKLLRGSDLDAAPAAIAKVPVPKAPIVGLIPGLDPAEISKSAAKNKARREKKKQAAVAGGKQ